MFDAGKKYVKANKIIIQNLRSFIF